MSLTAASKAGPRSPSTRPASRTRNASVKPSTASSGWLSYNTSWYSVNLPASSAARRALTAFFDPLPPIRSSRKEARVYSVFTLPRSRASRSTGPPPRCSNSSHTGQRGSSYRCTVTGASGSPTMMVVPSSPSFSGASSREA